MALGDSTIAIESLSQRLRGKKYASDLAAFLFEALLDGHDASSAGYFLRAAQILRNAVLGGEDVTEVVSRLPSLVKVAESIFGSAHMAQRTFLGNPRSFLQEYVGNKLDLIFKFNSRIRIYRVGASTDNYSIRLNHNMASAFAERVLAISEPPYEGLPDTSCLILRAERVLKAFEADQAVLSWYRDELGLGPVVPETYTWHIGAEGLVTDLSDMRTADLLALSFDLGARQATSPSNHERLQCNHLLLRLVDLLLECGYANTIYQGLHTLITGSEAPRPLEDLRTASRTSIRTNVDSPGQSYIVRQSSDGASAVVSYDTAENLFYDLDGAFLPAGFQSEAWAYCADDARALEVVSGWTKAVEQLRPSSVYLLGGSGTGKDLLARSIHTASQPTGKFVNFRPRNDPEVTHSMLEGAEAGSYTGVKEKKALPEIAAGGSVFFDEFLNYLPSDLAASVLMAGTIADLLDGREISTHKQRKWKPRALLIFSGDPEIVDPFFQTPQGAHWDRRGKVHIRVPKWDDLTHRSRIIIIRSLLLRALAEKGFSQGVIALSVIRELIANAGNLRGNGGKLRNALLAAMCSDGAGAINTDDLATQLADMQLTHSHWAAFPDRVVRMGPQSRFGERLSPTEAIVRLIAECFNSLGDMRCEGCIDEIPLREAAEVLATADEVLDFHYLLLAAVRHARPAADDTYRSRPMRVQQHFRNKMPYELLVNRTHQVAGREATPNDLFVHGRNSQKHPLGGLLLQHVTRRAAELQSKVERIGLAYPPFFHYVPYWGDALDIKRTRHHEEPRD
jgi:hypothetical protein